MQQKRVIIISGKSRAEYFRERRKDFRAFNVEIDRYKMESFEDILAEQGKTKKQWLDEKINEEIKNNPWI